MRDSSMNTENRRHNMSYSDPKRYHGRANTIAIGLDEEVYHLLHEEATRSGWSMRAIAGSIIIDFFDDEGSVDEAQPIRPKLRRKSK